MDIIELIKYLALCYTIYLTINHILVRFKFNLKNLPPSPSLSLPIIGHLYLFKKPLHRSLARVSARYGPILYLRFGVRNVLLLSSPQAIEECLVQNNAFVDRPRLLPGKFGGYNYTTLPFAPYGPHWRNQRRIAAVELLSTQRLQMLSGTRADVVQCFLRRVMEESMTKNGVVEMKFGIFGLLVDNVMRMLVGSSDFAGTDASRRFQEIMEESFQYGGATNIEDFLPILKVFKVFIGSIEEKLHNIQQEKDEFAIDLMREHRELEREGKLSDERKRSMLQVLLSLQKEDPQYYSDEFIQGLILTFIQTATDTSASTIVWALSLLLNHPEEMKKAQAEIDKNVGHGRLVEETDRNNLPYIECIINETFRMYPTGPLAVPHESRGDCRVGGYNVPKGSMLLYNVWAVHNDPNVWEQPRKFTPERFMGAEGNRLGCEFIPFGAGKRICPGESLARRMVWLAMAAMIQCFEWERIDEELVNMEEGKGLTLSKLEPLKAKCRPRSCMMNVLSQM